MISTTAISILYEDDWLLAINKPAGLLVHPLPNHTEPSLIDWLYANQKIEESVTWPDPTRPGIIHRLDRDTSGVLVVAKDPTTLEALQKQFAERTIKKTYLALILGIPTWHEYTLRAAVSRDDGTRRKASFLQLPADNGKEAETAFVVSQTFSKPVPGVSLIEAHPKTGRTNQIRVHLELLGHPILGDPWYQTKPSKRLSKTIGVQRLMLHAQNLVIHHSQTNEALELTAPMPNDMKLVIDTLNTNS